MDKENPTIEYSDFAKLDIRICKIKRAERVEGADKLLKLTVDVGSETRTLMAGIAESYKPEDVEGKQIPMLFNLAPRKLRGVESQGMILAADVKGKAILLHPDKKVPEGSRVY